MQIAIINNNGNLLKNEINVNRLSKITHYISSIMSACRGKNCLQADFDSYEILISVDFLIICRKDVRGKYKNSSTLFAVLFTRFHK